MEGDEDDADVDGEDEASEEQQIFTAAQILCGNMDESLRLWNGESFIIGPRLSRGQAVLDLLLQQQPPPGDDDDDDDDDDDRRHVGGGGGGGSTMTSTTTIDRPPPNKRIKTDVTTTTAPIRATVVVADYYQVGDQRDEVVRKPEDTVNDDGPRYSWPLERTRSLIRVFHELDIIATTTTTTNHIQRPFLLTRCWLDNIMMPSENNNGPARNDVVVEQREQDQPPAAATGTTTTTPLPPPFYSLFRNALISMAHLDIAAGLMDQSWDSKGNFVVAVQPQQQQLEQEQQEQREEGGASCDGQHSTSSSIDHIASALEYWPTNPSALLLAANVDRMRGGTVHLASALSLYRAAAKCAHITLHRLARHEILRSCGDENDDEDNDDNDLDGLFSNDEKFLAETVLCKSAQEEEEDDDGDGGGGESQVLVTATYMAALLASCLGQHDVAAENLRYFGTTDQPVTRIHPNVWKMGLQQSTLPSHRHDDDDNTLATKVTQGAFCPRVFSEAISPELFQTLRFAFRSDGPYWKESGYDRNVYYSFWTDYPLPRPPPPSSSLLLPDDNGNVNNDQKNNDCCLVGNAIEHYVVEHLLPRVRSVVASTAANDEVMGFEWWAHTRPHGANLGHQLHFDTDEALLEQDGTVETPIAATVTYLTLDADRVSYGATILFDQTPQSKDNAERAYICHAQPRSLLVFPGDLLHGVLPCTSSSPHSDDDDDSSSGTEYQRLTFMVNFWGYRIPDRITKRSLYGPSGPLPPPTEDHTWVRDICQGYPRTIPLPSSSIPPVPPKSSDNGLVAVTPAWETLSSTGINADATDEWSVSLPSPLIFPASGTIQQRFFVTNAPDYFHSTLLEK